MRFNEQMENTVETSPNRTLILELVLRKNNLLVVRFIACGKNLSFNVLLYAAVRGGITNHT